MIKNLIFTLCLFNINLNFSQEIVTEIKGKSLDYFVAIEKSLKSIPVELKNKIIEIDEFYNPILYRRIEKDIPDLIIEYGLSSPSSVFEIHYSWNAAFDTLKIPNENKSNKLNKKMIKKHESLLMYLTALYGKSKIEGIEDVSQIKSSLQKRQDVWTTNDGNEINLYFSLNDYCVENQSNAEFKTYKISLYVSNSFY